MKKGVRSNIVERDEEHPSIPRNKHFSHKQKKSEMKLNKLKQLEKRRKALEEDENEKERMYQKVHGSLESITISRNKSLEIPSIDSNNPLNTVFMREDPNNITITTCHGPNRS